MRSLPPERVRLLSALAAMAVALLAASAWLAEPQVGYLAAGILATGVAVVVLARGGGGTRTPLWVAVVALLSVAAVAGRAEWRLERFAHSPAEVAATQARLQQEQLARAVHDELTLLRRVSQQARAVPRAPAEAVRTLNRLVGDEEHRAIMVLRGDTLQVWAGKLHADPAALTAPSGVVATPFGLTLYVTGDSAGVRTIASSLLFAAAPADRLTRGLAQRLGGNDVVEGFEFGPPSDTVRKGEQRVDDGTRPLFTARAIVPGAGEVRFRLLERARVRVGLLLLIAMLAFLVALARREVGLPAVLVGALVLLRCIAIVPLSEFSTRSRSFDASIYFLASGRAYTSNAAALALTAGTVLLLVLLVVRHFGSRLSRPMAIAISAATIGIGPYVVGGLAHGIAPPAEGSGGSLWLIWTIPLCLAATTLLVLAAWAGRVALSGRRGVPAWSGPAVAVAAALLAPLVWQAPGQWPQWYGLVWALAVAAVVLSRPSRRALLTASSVAALAATTVVWANASRGRVELAERDVRGLSGPDSYGEGLALRLAASMEGEELPRRPQALLERFIASDLSASGYPVALVSWEGLQPVATFGAVPFDVAFDTAGTVAAEAQRLHVRQIATTRASVYGVRVIAVPMRGGAVTILLAPRTRLIGAGAYSRWYGIAASAGDEPMYTVQVVAESIATRPAINWRREGTELHGDWPVLGPSGPARAHVEVDLRGLDSLAPRGGLLAIVDMLAVAVVWLIAAIADGRVSRWLRVRRRRARSYRTRLSFALFVFFLVPAAAFAVWSWQQLFDDAQASRRLLVTETMRAVAGDPQQPEWLAGEARRLETKLLVYRSGVLSESSDSLFSDFLPMGRLLRADVALALNVSDEVSVTRSESLEGEGGMFGYRGLPSASGSLVLAAPARVNDLTLDRRRRDLGVLVLFATALGAAAALWLSGAAARQLARPIGALRAAARAVARGERDLPLDGEEASEFLPVFTAFRAMAADLGESRAALVESQRRTDAVLRTVASGVVAVDEVGHVILANPRAEQLLGGRPAPGDDIAGLAVPAITSRVARFLRSDDSTDGFELERDGRTLRGQLTRLVRGGAVLTLDDVTELARAQRVLAWGEMARQIAHEIKNPLTPIRLGVQHLRRAYGRDNYEQVLDQNVSRILGEIDRLDEIARAFSRYGSAPEERASAVSTDVATIVHDVVALETLGEGGVRWRCEVVGEVPPALARDEELREVLLNLFENARLAEATDVCASVRRASGATGEFVEVAVRDDGTGIAADVLPRIFEPHFSTRTSGSGLGLAITRRLVESWGGEVAIESELGIGTTVRVLLRAG